MLNQQRTLHAEQGQMYNLQYWHKIQKLGLW